MVFWADFPIAAMRLNAAKERAAAAGVPLTLQELRPGPPTPPEQNAALVYKRILAESPVLQETVDELQQASVGSGRPDPERVLRIAARASAQAEEVYRASKLPYYDLGADLDLGWHHWGEEFDDMRAMAKFFSYRGQAYARLGQAEEAARDLATIHRIAEHMGQDRLLITALVAHAIQAMSIGGAREAAALLADRPDALALLEREVINDGELRLDYRRIMLDEAYLSVSAARNLDLQTGMHPAVAVLSSEAMGWGEEVGILRWLEFVGINLPALSPTVDPATIRRSGKPPGWILQGSMARVLDGWAAFFEGLPESGATPADFQDAAIRMEGALQSPRLSYFWARGIARGNELLPSVLPGGPTDYQMTRAYVDVLQFRNQHGRWPESLAEAGVQALDPFDGKPLRYRVEGEGFLIWSVGHNARDDNGVTRFESPDGEADDLIAPFPLRGRAAPSPPATP